jgi:hypothetical protein
MSSPDIRPNEFEIWMNDYKAMRRNMRLIDPYMGLLQCAVCGSQHRGELNRDGGYHRGARQCSAAGCPTNQRMWDTGRQRWVKVKDPSELPAAGPPPELSLIPAPSTAWEHPGAMADVLEQLARVWERKTAGPLLEVATRFHVG